MSICIYCDRFFARRNQPHDAKKYCSRVCSVSACREGYRALPTPEHRKAISDGLKRAYQEGRRVRMDRGE
jgi:hypothetical protein